MKIQDLLVLALQILGPFPQKRMSSRSIEIGPRGGPPLKMGGPPLEFINIKPKKGGSASGIHQPKGGSASRFHQPEGGPPLEFINLQPQNGGRPLESINLKIGVRL